MDTNNLTLNKILNSEFFSQIGTSEFKNLINVNDLSKNRIKNNIEKIKIQINNLDDNILKSKKLKTIQKTFRKKIINYINFFQKFLICDNNFLTIKSIQKISEITDIIIKLQKEIDALYNKISKTNLGSLKILITSILATKLLILRTIKKNFYISNQLYLHINTEWFKNLINQFDTKINNIEQKMTIIKNHKILNKHLILAKKILKIAKYTKLGEVEISELGFQSIRLKKIEKEIYCNHYTANSIKQLVIFSDLIPKNKSTINDAMLSLFENIKIILIKYSIYNKIIVQKVEKLLFFIKKHLYQSLSKKLDILDKLKIFFKIDHNIKIFRQEIKIILKNCSERKKLLDNIESTIEKKSAKIIPFALLNNLRNYL